MARLIQLALGAAVALAPMAASAQLRGTAEGLPLVGSRTEAAGQIVTGDRYANDGLNMTLNWSVALNGGVYTYTYRFTGFAGSRRPANSPAISHFILGLSSTCPVAPTPYDGTNRHNGECVIDPELNGSNISGGEIRLWTSAQGNVGMPGSLYGVKFDTGTGSGATYTFESLRTPVWGDFYVKGGNSFAYNAGLATNSNLAAHYIAVPNSMSAVPEPATVALLGSGLLALGGFARRRTRSMERSSATA